MLATSQAVANTVGIIANLTLLAGLGWRLLVGLNKHLDAQRKLAKKLDRHTRSDRRDFRQLRRQVAELIAQHKEGR